LKIFLISVNTVTDPFYSYPIGMGVVTNIMQSNGHSVKQFDFFAEGLDYGVFCSQLDLFKPDIVGISIRNNDFTSIKISSKITAFAKEKHYPVFIGGPGFTSIPDEFMRQTNADFGLLGPAESNLVEFINNFQKGVLPEKNIIPFKKFDAIYAPVYDKKILNFYSKHDYALGVYTKKGCIHNCCYCNYKYIDGLVCLYRDIDEVIKELKLLQNKYKIKSFFFADSVVNDNTDFFANLLKAMIKNKIKIRWSAFLRPEYMNDEIIPLMKETGMTTAILNIDASNDITLKTMRKGFKWSDVERTDELFLKHNVSFDVNVSSRASFIFGGPDETKESVFEGIANIKKLHFTNMTIFIFDENFAEGMPQISKTGASYKTDLNWIREELVKAFKNYKNILLDFGQNLDFYKKNR